MIKLYEYYLTPDGENLVLNVMPNHEEYTNCRLTSVRLSTTGDFDSSDVSAQKFDTYLQILVDEGEIVIAEGFKITVPLKMVFTNCQDLNNPYYLKVTAAADNSTCTTVKELDSIIFNKYPLYKAISCAANAMEGCEPPQVLIDYLFRLKILEAAVALGTGNREQINYYYNWLIKQTPSGNPKSNSKGRPVFAKSPCGCGR